MRDVSRFPVIVIEGADAAGKTTLSEEIVRLTGARYVHMTYRFEKDPRRFLAYQRAAMELCLRLSRDAPVVLDRWWLSDEVYGAEFRGGSTNSLTYRQLDRVALRYGFTYVFCCPSDEEGQARRHGLRRDVSGEMYSTLGGLPGRYRAWYESMKHRYDVVLYDMDRVKFEEVGEIAEAVYQHASDSRAELYEGEEMFLGFNLRSRFFSGNPTCHRALVGKFDDSSTRRGDWPLSGMAGPAMELSRALDADGLGEESLLVVDLGSPLATNEVVHKLVEGKVVFAAGEVPARYDWAFSNNHVYNVRDLVGASPTQVRSIVRLMGAMP